MGNVYVTSTFILYLFLLFSSYKTGIPTFWNLKRIM